MALNSMAFSKEEVEAGLHTQLIEYLLDYNAKANNWMNDIHITSDGYTTIVRWEQVTTDRDFGGAFVHIDEKDMDFVPLTSLYDGSLDLTAIAMPHDGDARPEYRAEDIDALEELEEDD